MDLLEHSSGACDLRGCRDFGHSVGCTCDRKVEDYLVKLRECQALLIKVTQDYLKNNQRKFIKWASKGAKFTKFEVGQYFLLQFPSKLQTNGRYSIMDQ